MNGMELIAEHPIFVNVFNIPPVPVDNFTIISRVLEDEELDISKGFEYALNLDNVSIQWEKVHPGKTEIIAPDPRFTYTFNVHTLMLLININETWLSDDGTYRITISNQYGSTVLMVRLHVDPLSRITVELHFIDVSCEWIQVR